jgi:hypothetical protein
MDPDAALTEMRALILTMNTDSDLVGDRYADAGYRLVELVDGLDNWLSSGGFLPSAWANAPTQPEDEDDWAMPEPVVIGEIETEMGAVPVMADSRGQELITAGNTITWMCNYEVEPGVPCGFRLDFAIKQDVMIDRGVPPEAMVQHMIRERHLGAV